MTDKLRVYLRSQGWKLEMNQRTESVLPDEIYNRYKNIVPQWYDFIEGLNALVSEDETTWFLCFKDFYEQNEDAFQWNEWERISLESAGDDVEWKKEIRAFWDIYFPIVMSVKDGYSYYAMSMENGAIVYGCEPEFEECETVADSFDDFMDKIVDGKIQL